MRGFCSEMIVAGLLGLCCPVQAQTYPTREIHVVVGLPAGSGGDVIARFYADKLAQICGKPVIVENKPGMILSIGAESVARARPDGYTLLITSVTSSHAANLFNFKKLPYDPIKDFAPVAMLTRSYFVLTVRPEAPWKTVAELTAAMKIKGAKASYGYGSPPALASAELYKVRAGLEAVAVPYRTSMASLSEMFSGELDFQFIDATAVAPLLESGQAAWSSGHRKRTHTGRRHADHDGSRQYFGVRHRTGVGRAASRRYAAADRRPARIVVRTDFEARSDAHVSGQHSRRILFRKREGTGRIHPQRDQKVGGIIENREDRAAMSCCGTGVIDIVGVQNAFHEPHRLIAGVSRQRVSLLLSP